MGEGCCKVDAGEIVLLSLIIDCCFIFLYLSSLKSFFFFFVVVSVLSTEKQCYL